MMEGPLEGQGDCGVGLVCMGADLSATVGVCAVIQVLDPRLDCDYACMEVGVICLEELGCPEAGDFCNAAGCS